MPLDDFFAKKDKKKAKKKKNPQDLIEKLDKEVAKLTEKEGDASLDVSKKLINIVKDDEWETLDDDVKEVDLQTIKIGKLSLNSADESSKTSKEKVNVDEAVPVDGEKKVWAAKIIEGTDQPTEPAAPAESERPVGGLRIPAHLRLAPVVNKPDVESAADFPTLGAVTETESTVNEKNETEDYSWEQAGVSRKPARAPDMLPIAVNESRYMPPGLRGSQLNDLPIAQRTEHVFDSRPHYDEAPGRYEAMPSRRSERPAPRDAPYSSSGFGVGDDWSRGSTIKSSGFGFGLGSGSGPSTVNPPARHSAFPSVSSSGWDRGSTIKTFKEEPEQKKNFELSQFNRFAGLSET